ncbi:MAG TPA: zinc-ribbon domain-containing protein [Firmicutes bacterium]|nr:zinc-ribbon domain-containing protein [Bacillota bacterium]
MKEKFCNACGLEFKTGEPSIRCSLCMRNYHVSCWAKAGGCTTWGCPGRPALTGEEQSALQMRCPNCGESIVNFAVKCPYCRKPLFDDVSAAEKRVREIHSKEGQVRKDPILTALLNLIFPGAGYMYLGFFNKGLLWFVVAVAAWFFTRGLGLVAVYAWVIYDSSRLAVIMNRGENPSNGKTMLRP